MVDGQHSFLLVPVACSGRPSGRNGVPSKALVHHLAGAIRGITGGSAAGITAIAMAFAVLRRVKDRAQQRVALQAARRSKARQDNGKPWQRNATRPRDRGKPGLATAPTSKTPRGGLTRQLHSAGDVLSTGDLGVGDGFSLYYEVHGSEAGIPVVFLHGGPGAGCTRRMAQLFDKSRYRIILFDQRGCGRSKKQSADVVAQLKDNTTWHLVRDMEALRVHLRISRWIVAGGSWGTCLALAYASRHRDRVAAMALRGLCMFRDAEMDYFCGSAPEGARSFVSEAAWKEFAGWLPEAGTRPPGVPGRWVAAAFRRAALGNDESLAPQDATSKWGRWENQLFATRPRTGRIRLRECPADPDPDLALLADAPLQPWPNANISMMALLTMHYVAERGFFPPGFDLVEEAASFDFPVKVVHGRNDCICPVANAEDLAAASPEHVELLLTSGGHSQWDPANIDAFVRATDALADDMSHRDMLEFVHESA